jgi:hypothetical protein
MRKDPKEESEKCINTDQEDIKSIGGRERRVGPEERFELSVHLTDSSATMKIVECRPRKCLTQDHSRERRIFPSSIGAASRITQAVIWSVSSNSVQCS